MHEGLQPFQVRRLIAEGEMASPTAGICPGYVQANLVILKNSYAKDFLDFVLLNPKPCPLLEVIDDGTPISKKMAPGSDVTKDIPLYRVFIDGKFVEEPSDISSFWENGMIAFLIGCSLTFEEALVKSGIRLKHYEQNKRVPMYDTNIPCAASKKFHGNYVVSMRPIKNNLIEKAIEITSQMEYAHGAPVQIGNPQQIGIKNINAPDYGDPLEIEEDETPVFWACGVTPQAAAIKAKPDIMMTHSPGYMLICDKKIDNFIS